MLVRGSLRYIQSSHNQSYTFSVVKKELQNDTLKDFISREFSWPRRPLHQFVWQDCESPTICQCMSMPCSHAMYNAIKDDTVCVSTCLICMCYRIIRYHGCCRSTFIKRHIILTHQNTSLTYDVHLIETDGCCKIVSRLQIPAYNETGFVSWPRDYFASDLL